MLTEAKNLSREACTAGVKSAGWWQAKVTSRQWLRSCGDRKGQSIVVDTLLLLLPFLEPLCSLPWVRGPQALPPGPRCFLPDLRTHLEVDGIHTQLVGVQVAQSGQGTGQVIEVACSIGQRISDLLAMSLDLSGAVAHIKVREVGLGGGEASEHPVRK